MTIDDQERIGEISNAIEIYKMIHDHVGGDGEKTIYQRPIKIKNST